MKKTVLIKLSGEALANNKGHGLDFDYINLVCSRIAKMHDNRYKVAIVCGGGNFVRGRDTNEMERERADYAGMMATIINSLVLKDVFIKLGYDVYTQSGLSISIMDDIDSEKAKMALDSGKIIVFGGGIGKPYYSTDTAAAFRAREIEADLIIKLTNVDGVYDKDPNKYDDAIMYKEVSFDEVMEKELGVMDLSAIEICRDNNIEIIVTNINDSEALVKIMNDEKVGTHVYKEV